MFINIITVIIVISSKVVVSIKKYIRAALCMFSPPDNYRGEE